MERLRINNGQYLGERIDIDDVLRQIESLARKTDWEAIPITVSDGESLPAYQRIRPHARRNVYISTGIHGDEPAGPLAALELFRRANWPDDVNVWLVPCLNRHGFAFNCRGDCTGIDLNRDYRAFKSPVVRAHARWLDARPSFAASLLLHEDWESHGFYLYELNPDRRPSIAEAVIEAVQSVCPIDLSAEIEGRPAEGGIICANPDLQKRPDWPEAFYLIHNKTRLSYTLEAPSDFSMSTRVNALVTATEHAMKVI
jgi:protein MpaA